MRWLIGDLIEKESIKRLCASLDKFDVSYHLFTESPIVDFNKIHNLSPLIYYGSLGCVNQVNQKFYPGAFCDLKKLKCSSYYPYFGDKLLNEDYALIPYGDLKRRKDWLYEHFGIQATIFIRPDSGFKIFTGKQIYYEYFDKDIDNLGYDLKVDDLVLVTTPKMIFGEYRFFVADGKVITGSEYGRKKRKIDENWTLFGYAQNMADIYTPERLCVFDLCDGPKLVEINSFSCAGLYECDTDIIVKKANEIALDMWNEDN